MMLFKILIASLSFLILGCGGMTVKHMNPDEPNALASNERIVFGRVIFVTHSEKMGEVSFPPCGLGLIHVETEERARQAAYLPSRRPWFENDGTFFWILATGNYHIDALAWGFHRTIYRHDPDPENPEKHQVIAIKPDKPPECGFVVSPNMVFNVSGESGALYIGTLLIDIDIKKENGIKVKNINSIEIRDEYAEALELLTYRYPSISLTVEKSLMTSIPDVPVSVASARCPSKFEVIMKDIVLQMLVSMSVPSPSISIPSFGIGR
jgi:hypothetical protein